MGGEGGGHEGALKPSLQGEKFHPCSMESFHHRWQPMELPKL